MEIAIAAERPDSSDGALLIAELEAELEPLYPPRSRHGYSVQKLIDAGVAFFVVRCDGIAAGCGGLQFSADYAEVKRMYIRPQRRGLGLGRRLLDHLALVAGRGGATCLCLETGIYQAAAIRLYESAGFRQVGPFGDYLEDPLSLFYRRFLP